MCKSWFTCVFGVGVHCLHPSTIVTSSHDDVIEWKYFRVTGHLCGEFTSLRWIPHTKASDTELWCFLWSAPNEQLSKHSWGWWLETTSSPLWRHSNDAGMAAYSEGRIASSWSWQHRSIMRIVRCALTRHRRFLVVASQSGFMPTQTTMPPTGIGGRNHAKITTYHYTIFVISNSLGHNLSIDTMIFAWQILFNL